MLLDNLTQGTATVWWICALVTLGCELMSGTLYLLVVALALAGGGLAALTGAGNDAQFVVASVTGLLAYAAVRGWKRRHPPTAQSAADADADLGQTVRIVRVDDDGHARVTFRGAEWDARIIGPAPAVGATARIVGRDGNRLDISVNSTGHNT